MMTSTLDYARQAGRVGPHKESHEERLLATNFLLPGVTPVSGFMKFSVADSIGSRWGMAFNADLGCCGFSMWQHYNAAIAIENGEPWEKVRETTWLPHFPNLPSAYYAYGIAQGEPGPHPDEGVSNAAMLAWAYKLGLIDGYLEVPLAYADWYAKTFHGMGLGQVLDGPTAISDFNAHRPWDAMGKSDGHDTLYTEGDGEGGGVEITWGNKQLFTPAYRANNWTDGWVIVDKENPNVDQVKLDAILTEMHGVTERPSNNVHKVALYPFNDIHNIFDKGKELLEEHYKALDRELLSVLTKSMNRAEIALITAELLRIAAEIGV
jgi:hypothetical protein